MTAPRPLTLKPLRWWDISAVAQIEAELFATDSPWTEAMFWSELAMQHFYLACWDSSPDNAAVLVGYAGLASHGDEAEVQTIALLPDYHGQGAGRRMLAALLTEAGDIPVTLEVRTDNLPAINLYESMGFTTIGVRRGYYQPSNADAYTMVRK